MVKEHIVSDIVSIKIEFIRSILSELRIEPKTSLSVTVYLSIGLDNENKKKTR